MEETQKAVTSAEDLHKLQQERIKEIDSKYDELYDELSKGEYFAHGYSDESVVMIPGKLFGQFVNFVNAQMQTLNTIGQSLQILQNTNDALITNVSEMTIELMKQHKANVDNGHTKTMEELDKEDADKTVKAIPNNKNTKKKAKKTISAKEEDTVEKQ